MLAEAFNKNMKIDPTQMGGFCPTVFRFIISYFSTHFLWSHLLLLILLSCFWSLLAVKGYISHEADMRGSADLHENNQSYDFDALKSRFRWS